jgi:hypothetical protein
MKHPLPYPRFASAGAAVTSVALAALALAACSTADDLRVGESVAQPYAGPVITLHPTGEVDAPASIAVLTAAGAASKTDGAFTPAGDQGDATALAYLNARRQQAGLSPLAPDPGVTSAAAAHARYLAMNSEQGHAETTGATGFSGADVTSRVRRYTPTYGAGEVLSVVGGYSPEDPGSAMDEIFSAPYHRGVILFDWGRAGAAKDAGSTAGGTRRMVTVVDFADVGVTQPDNELIAWPYDGEQDVPPSWIDIEQPDPMGLPGYAGQTLGYPITLSGGPGAHITLSTLDLRDATGTRVACHIAALTPADAGRNTATCTPYRPLKPGTRYVGELTQPTFARAPFDLKWSFTTLPELQNRNGPTLAAGERASRTQP